MKITFLINYLQRRSMLSILINILDVADAYDKRSMDSVGSERQSKNKVMEIEKKRLSEKEGVLLED